MAAMADAQGAASLSRAFVESPVLRYEALRSQAWQARGRLREAGKLPDPLQVGMSGARDRLAEDEVLALLSMAPRTAASAGHGMWMVLVHGVNRPVAVKPAAGANAALHVVPFEFGPAAEAIVAAAKANALGRAGPTRRAATQDTATRDAEMGDSVTEVPPETLFERAENACSEVAHAVLTHLANVLPEHVRRVHLVPTGALHLVPWTWLAQQHLPRHNLRLYPNAGAWYRGGQPESAETEAPKRVAMICHDAWPHRAGDLRPILWAAAEARLSAAMWNDSAEEVVALHRLSGDNACWPPAEREHEPPVDTLLGIGHGGSPQGFPDRAGLLLGTGDAHDGGPTARVFAAADLFRIRQTRHLMMSCCVLAQTRDVMGEPLGMLADAFGFRLRQAVGSLVCVGDLDAMLVSLSVQWMVRRAGATWPEALGSVQKNMARGCWPDGFADWLGQELPKALADKAVLQGPSEVDPDNAQDRQQLWYEVLEQQMHAAGLGGMETAWDEDWDGDLRRLAAALCKRVPDSTSRYARWYVAFGR